MMHGQNHIKFKISLSCLQQLVACPYPGRP